MTKEEKKIYDREYYLKNKEKICSKVKEYRDSNKEKVKKSKDNYNQENKEKVSEYQKVYRENNNERLKELDRERNSTIERKELREKYNKSEKGKAQRRKTRKRKIYDVWRSILNNCLNRMGKKKEGHTIDLLRYSTTELKEHIEPLFTEGMTWGNHGEWHIDHIIPVSLFHVDTPVYVINALSNLKPMWATTREMNGVIYEGNLNKGNKHNQQ